jgi:ABC-type enterobactin transport system permease subunit
MLLVKVCESASVYASRTPYSVLMCGALVSLAGSFVAYQMAQDVATMSPMVIGMLAGAISGTLLGIMIATSALNLSAASR